MKYVCKASEPPRDQFGYEPICPFPYLPEGWHVDKMRMGEYKQIGDGLIMNTCTRTWADATDGRYAKKCSTYMVLSIFPAIICISYIKILNHNKRQSRAYKDNKTHWLLQSLVNPNLSEKLCWLNIGTAVTHFLLSYDIDCWAGKLTLNMKQFLMAFNMASMVCILVMLVTAWITVVDGGAKRATPRWAKVLSRVCMIGVFLGELIGGQLQSRMNKAAIYDVYTDGMVIMVKWNIFIWALFIWGCLAYVYGLKISQQLKSNSSKVSSEVKKIKKFCYTAAILTAAAFIWRLIPIFMMHGQTYTYYGIPPCVFSSSAFINNFILFLQYGICYAQQPGQKKATTRLLEAVKSTIFTGGKSSKSRKSTKATGTGAGSSANSSGVGAGQSTKSSANSSGASSAMSSAMSSATSSAASSGYKSSSIVPESSAMSSVGMESSVASEMDSAVESIYDEIENDAEMVEES